MINASTTMSPAKPQYTVDVYGFSQTERIILRSIFNLSARRVPNFFEFTPTMGSAPDIFLVDAEDAIAIADFRQKNAMNPRPAVLIGDTDHGISCTTLPRPLQWTKLFKAFDLAVGISTPSLMSKPESATRIEAPHEKTQQMAAITSALRLSATAIAPPQISNTAAQKSVSVKPQPDR